MKVSLLLLLCGICVGLTNSAKILGVLQVPTFSHQIIGSSLLKALAKKGHQVTMISPVPLKESIPNFRTVHLDGVQQIMDDSKQHFFEMRKNSMWKMLQSFFPFANDLANTTLRSPAMQNLLKSDENFDLILIEPFGNEAFYGLSHRFNAPIVVICTASNQWVNHLMGNEAPYSFVPNILTTYSDHMTFFERIMNSITSLMWTISINLKSLPVQEELYKEFFPGAPDFYQSIKNTSLALINSHPVFESPRPYLPNMIPVGGLHIQNEGKLPQDLQAYLDDAKDGVIFFSLGSNLQSNFLDDKKREAILKTFARLPQKVLWKFEDENLAGKPDNVRIGKWFPQSEILAHPNVKLFITHGGLLSSIEALYRGVPIVGIPFYGDQHTNTAHFSKSGYGTKIYLDDITEDTFTKTLQEVLNNPRYYENIKRTSKILKDQPMKPMDRAIFWIEHVVKHKGASYLRPSSLDLTLAQYLLLDVFIFAIAVVGTFTTVILFLIKRVCCHSRTKKVQFQKNDKSKSKKA